MTTLFEAFWDTAHRYPTQVALIDFHTDEALTYAGLLAQIEACMSGLQFDCQVQPGERVGMLLTNQVAFVTAFFALQALGVVVIPLNYRLTARELDIVLDDAGAVGLISSPEFDETVQSLQRRFHWHITTSADTNRGYSLISWLKKQPSQPGKVDLIGIDALAVLIYTSGTTGQPKGVMLSHRNLLADAKANGVVIAATDQDVFVTASPLFHVFGLTNILLTALTHGARIILIKRFNPKQLLEAITRYQVTFLAAVPTMYQMLLEVLPLSTISTASLRVCHSGAAPMPIALFSQIESILGALVQEGYGQSEASSIITCNPLHGPRKPGSIGLGLPGLMVEIVDSMGNTLGPNEVGELRVSGDTVMQGYWQRPELTEAVLKDGWLYTRDMGYVDAEGYIFLVGRQDDLINVGGSKIYPREVEEVIYQHPAVAACAAAAEPSDLYGQIVAAFVVLKPHEKCSVMQLQRFCRDHLASFKVPKAVYFVREIPQGATGKILRHRLHRD